MQATRYRLRFVAGIATQAVTYGSATYGTDNYGGADLTDPRGYGTGTYGERTYGEGTSFPTNLDYQMVPWTGGFPTAPSWIYRVGDTSPDWQARIFGDGQPVDLTDLYSAELVITPVDGRGWYEAESIYSVARIPSITGLVTHIWTEGELANPGTYRAAVYLQFNTGHTLSVTADDVHTFVINDIRPGPQVARHYGDDQYGSGAYGGIHIHPPYPVPVTSNGDHP